MVIFSVTSFQKIHRDTTTTFIMELTQRMWHPWKMYGLKMFWDWCQNQPR